MQTEERLEALKDRVDNISKEQLVDRQKHAELREWVLEGTSALKTEVGVMKNDIHHIRQTQGQIVSGVNRVVYAIVLACIGAFMAFALQGGLVVN